MPVRGSESKTTYVPGKGYTGKTVKVRRKKPTVVTVTSSGHVTATGPGASAAKQKTVKSVRHAKKIGRQVAREEAARKKIIGATFHPGTKQVATNPVQAVGKYIAETPERVLHGGEKEFKEGRVSSPFKKGSALDSAFQTAALETGPGSSSSAIRAAGKASSAVSAGEALRRAAKGLRKAPAKKIARVKSAPERAVKRVRETPKRVKTAPKRARKAVSTPEGRKTVARTAGKKAAKHPVRTGTAAAAVSPIPLPGEADKRAKAFIQGTAAAVVHHPKEVGETTVHAALGGLAAPLALGGAAISSVKHGSPKPLEEQVSTFAKGTAKMAKNLASGNAKKVEETTIHETGVVPFIPLPHLARRLKGTRTYEAARAALRDTVENVRRNAREKHIAAEKGAESFKARQKAAKKVERHKSVEDSQRPGEHYALKRTGRTIEKQHGRHRLSREITRMEEEGVLAGGIAGSKVLKALKKSKGANREPQNYGDALRIFAKHGIPKDEAKGMAIVDMIHKNWPKMKEGETAGQIHLDRDSTQFILDHPQIFHDKHFWNAVKEFEAQSEHVGLSERNRFLAQVHNVINPLLAKEGRSRILAPEEMVPDSALKVLPKRSKNLQPWNRSEALSYLNDLKDVTGRDGPRARRLEKQLEQSLSGLMKPPEHGGAEHGISTTQAVAYTPQMLRAFTKAARREGSHFGLRKPAAYVSDVVPSSLHGAETVPEYGGLHPVNKVWPSQGKAARSGNAESSLESVIYHSLEAPHARQAGVRGLQRIFDFSSRKIGDRRYFNEKEWNKLANQHQIPDGVVPVRTQMLRALLEDPHMTPERFQGELDKELEHGQKLIAGEELAGDFQAAKELGLKGEKYAAMDATAIHELTGHMKGPLGVSRYMGHATNFSTRVILNSPAFELAQFAQEGIPMAAALGRDVANVPKAVANLGEIAKLDPQSQAMIRVMYGSSVGVLGAPKLRAWKSSGFMDPIRAAGGKSVWRHAWEVANGTKVGMFDIARAGKMREVAGASRLEGDLNRAWKGFHAWRSSANNLFKDMEHATEAMKGMSPTDRQLYIASHPELGDRVMREMNGMAGNWNSFTVFEKNIAPFTIFYPFQRYVVLWTLYHFPLDHPVVATGLATLGAVNAQELQKIAKRTGSTPGPLDYAKPVINGNVLPAGQRFSSLLGSIQQAILEHKPYEAVSALTPPLSLGIEGIVGKNAYTGQPLGMSGWEYLARQGVDLSPFARLLGIPKLGEEQSPGSKLYHSQDEARQERSFINPFIGQSGQNFANEKLYERLFAGKYGSGHLPTDTENKLVQELLYGGPEGKPQPHLLQKVIKAIHGSEASSKALTHYEKPYFPKEAEGNKVEATRERLREAVENSWQTGPNVEQPKKKARKTSGIGGPSGGGIGGGTGGGIGGGTGGGIGGGSGGGIGGGL